jgi:hypothetical protein
MITEDIEQTAKEIMLFVNYYISEKIRYLDMSNLDLANLHSQILINTCGNFVFGISKNNKKSVVANSKEMIGALQSWFDKIIKDEFDKPKKGNH